MSRRSNRAAKSAAAGREMERLSLVRNEYLREVLAEVPEHKDRFISDERLYTMDIPTCGSGSSVSGKMFFPVGAMLECWENCPEFRLADGSYFIHWSGGLSGLAVGESYNPLTGEIKPFSTSRENPLPWSGLALACAPYRQKAARLISGGVVPESISVLRPVPEEVKVLGKQLSDLLRYIHLNT